MQSPTARAAKASPFRKSRAKVFHNCNFPFITPGAVFGAQGEGYFSLSAFNSRENAEEVARRLKKLA